MSSGLGGTRVKKIAASAIKIDQRELCARLGGSADDMPTNIYNSLLSSANCGYCLAMVDISFDEGAVAFCDERARSYGLARAMDGCTSAILLTATLGFGVDRYISTLGARGASSQLYADALADALIEGLCDMAEEELACEGLVLTNRFSPGYGDLSLSLGPVIVRLLGADRSLGIRYTDSGLALPKKTVTAFIGVRDNKK